MAGGVSDVTSQALKNILSLTVSAPLYRDSAAALTVAFEIRRAIAYSQGETITTDEIVKEVREVYHRFMAVTDPSLAAQAARKS
ncbi:MAG: hypothetical protein ACLQAT_02330 [Candidatus Binataceae bacterium]